MFMTLAALAEGGRDELWIFVTKTNIWRVITQRNAIWGFRFCRGLGHDDAINETKTIEIR